MAHPSTHHPPRIRNGAPIAEVQAGRAATLQKYRAFHADHPLGSWRDFVFNGLTDQRDTIIAAYRQAGLHNCANAIDACNRHVHLWRHTRTGLVMHRPMLCRQRACPNCGTWYGRPRRERFLNSLPAPIHRLSFLTLTQRANPRWGLRYSLTNLLAAFRKFRRDPLWTANVHAGAYVFEITYNEEAHWYHAHVHIIIDAKYMNHELLKQAWTKVLGYRANLDIREAESAAELSPYLAKYLSKPIPTELLHDPETLADYLSAMHRLRLIAKLGAWVRNKDSIHASSDAAVAANPDNDDSAWVHLGELDDFLERARRGDQDAIAVLVQAGYGRPAPSMFHQSQPTHTDPRGPPPTWLFDQKDAA